MQTIEQLLKTTVETAINTITNDIYERPVYLTNDLHFHDSETLATDIIGVIRTGSGTRSNIPGFNAIQSSLQIMFEVEANWVQQFMGCLAAYIQDTNGVVATVTDTRDDETTESDITYSYRIDWEIPLPTGTPYRQTVKSSEDNIKTETAAMMVVLLRGTVTYSADQSLNDRKIYIEGTAFAWDASTSAYWNASGVVNGSYDIVSNSTTNSSALPAGNASNIAGRVTFNNASAYYKSNGYTELDGITSYSEKFMPVHSSSQPVNAMALDLNFETYQTVYSIGFTRNKADANHNRIANIPHGNISATSADLKLRFDITSLNTASYEAVKITELQISQIGGFETVNINLIKE